MILVNYRGERYEINKTREKLERILLDLGINPEDVLVLKEGKLLTEDSWLKDGDEVTVWEVVSRG